MNRTSLLVTLVLISQAIASAQILIGPVVGPQLGWVSFEDKDQKKLYTRTPVAGFHAGMGISFRVHKRFFLNGALLYSTKGKNLTGTGDELLKFKSRYRYIDLPMAYTVEFKSNVSKTKAYKWYFGMGPHVSYWLSGKGSLENTQLSEILVNRIDYKIVYNQEPGEFEDNQMNVPDPNRLQLGLNLSAGFVFEPLGYQKMMVNIRYEAGHSLFSRSGEGKFNLTNEYTDNLFTRNQGFRLSFAYLIDLKNEEKKKGKSTIDKKRMK
jgi:Outer membrane protein beta-barrel domain